MNSENKLNPYQLYSLSNLINETSECPISGDLMERPCTTPCGHTFDQLHLEQALEYKSLCPMDRSPVSKEQLVENLFIKELSDNKIKILFLRENEFFNYLCFLSRKPKFEAVSLPYCDHTFNKSALDELAERIKNGNKRGYSCPLHIDNKPFKPSQMIPNLEESELAKNEYPKYLERVRKINSELTLKVIQLQLDARCEYEKLLVKIKNCPISGGKIKSPVLAPCGHTFDLSSILEESVCPFDKSSLKTKDLIPNIAAKIFLESLNDTLEKSLEEEIPELKDKCGVLLFLQPETTLNQIVKIGKTLKINNEFRNNASIYCDSSNRSDSSRRLLSYDINEKISNNELLKTKEGIPIIFIN